jgi:PAS domain S-box-containing protein
MEYQSKTKKELIEEIKALQEKNLNLELLFGKDNVTEKEVREWKEAENALKESEERYRTLFYSANDAIFILDADGYFIEINPIATEHLGYTKEEFLQMNIADIDDPDYSILVKERIETIQNKGQLVFESRHVRKDGTKINVEISSRAIEYGGEPALLSIVRDITERKETEHSLKESERTLWATVNAVSDTLYLIKSNGAILTANKTTGMSLSRPVDEIIGKNIYNLLSGPIAKVRRSQFEEVIRTGKPSQIEDEWYGRWNEVNIYPVFEDNKVTRLAIYSRDVTERKLAEMALVKNERMMQTLVSNLPGMVYRCHNDRKRTMEYLSEGCMNVTGYEPSDLTKNAKLAFNEIIISDDREMVWSAIQNGVLSNKPYQMVYRIRTATGDLHWVWEKGNGILNESGELITLEGFITDISDRIKAEREIETKNKELEQIVYVTSHDLRSPLVNVQGYSKELGYSIDKLASAITPDIVSPETFEKIQPLIETDIPESLRYIENSIAKMDSLLHGLLRLSRSSRIPVKLEKLNMNELVAKVVSNFEYRIKTDKIQVEVSDLPMCKSDNILVNQVFSNLIDNALKYLSPHRAGKVKITGYKENRYSVYCIEDNGIGIAEEHIDKIFEIFYRLNPKSLSGEGLGLSIVQKIIGRLNGEIKVESEVDEGSKFFVFLSGI